MLRKGRERKKQNKNIPDRAHKSPHPKDRPDLLPLCQEGGVEQVRKDEGGGHAPT